MQTKDIINFHDWLVMNGRSNNTVKAYTSDLSIFLDWVDKTYPEPTAAIATELAMATYLNTNRGAWSPSTTKRKLACFRAYGKWKGISVLVDYKAPTVPAGVPHPLSGGVDDIVKMYDRARRPPHKAMVVLIGLLGLRISEARSVKWSDFDDASGDIVLTVRGKGDKTRHLPVDPRVMAMLDEPFLLAQSRGDGLLVPLTDRAARRAWTRIGQRAGISRPTATHDGRMTFGTVAYDKDKDIRAVQELLGHSSSTTTERYTGISMAKKRAAATVL